jgi:hypothetical protein
VPSRLSIRRRFTRRPPLARRFVAWALLATYATTASGVPLPRFSAATSTESHPCQTHRCGCATAEQCWKSCCCYSNGQKLAWAAERGVTVPEFVVAAARVEAAQPLSPTPARACCRSKRSCCEPSLIAGVPAGCDKAHDERPDESSIEFVSLLQSERCRGTTPTWGGVAISLVPAPPARCPAFDPQVCRSTPWPPAAKPQAFSSPSVPPPRAA